VIPGVVKLFSWPTGDKIDASQAVFPALIYFHILSTGTSV